MGGLLIYFNQCAFHDAFLSFRDSGIESYSYSDIILWGDYRMFGKKKEKAEDQLQMVKLCNVASFVDAESKLARLKNEGIPCYRMEQGAGGYHTVMGGPSPVGYDIYVALRDAERAAWILEL